MVVEFIPRPVQGTNPVETRLLWHWSAATQRVDKLPNGESLTVASEFEQTTIGQAGSPVPLPIFAAHMLPEELGKHVHYLRYILDDSPPAASGAYGFFTQFFAPPYEKSVPLLIVLNNGLDESTLRTAALAINAAAADAVPLTGDYNQNGAVDAADYVVWRNTLGSMTALAADGSGNRVIDAADYSLWRSNFGRSSGNGAFLAAPMVSVLSGTLSASVPEPNTWIQAAGAAAAACTSVMSRRGKRFRRINKSGQISIDANRPGP
jgi:hypothetical protein